MIDKRQCILCIDLGTSTLKVSLFSCSGAIFYFKTYKHDRSEVHPKNLDFLYDCGTDIQLISAISLSSQAPSIVPILNNGEIGTPIFYHEKEKKIKRDDCISVFLPQVAYHKNIFPQEYKRTQTYLTLGDYLIYLFTGNFYTSLPEKNYHQVVWESKEIELYDLDSSKFPPPVIWPSCAGRTQKGLPIPQNIRVLACNYDFLSAILGLNACSSDIAVERAGSSIGLNFFVSKKHLELIKKHLCHSVYLNWSIYPHIYPNAFNVGIVFQDFDIFLSEILEIFSIKFQNSISFENLFTKILTPISISDISDPPRTAHLSFLKIWKELSHITFPLLRAQQVFIEYTRFLYHCLSRWPLGPIKEVRASGKPNQNLVFLNFKSKMTKIPWQVSSVIHSELLGNFQAVITKVRS